MMISELKRGMKVIDPRGNKLTVDEWKSLGSTDAYVWMKEGGVPYLASDLEKK